MTETMIDTKPHDHGDDWDRADIRNLTRLVKQRKKQKQTWQWVGDQLGRTGDAARSKARRLGL